jgi:hypothetical protein
MVVAAVRHASAQGRREITRVRSFRNILLVAALLLALGAAGMIAVGATNPGLVPLCFNPEGLVVCPTEDRPAPGQSGAIGTSRPPLTPEEQARVDDVIRETANRWDIPLVELVGCIAAALPAATTLRRIKGTSTEYNLPVALAVLKLPTGALTALLGLFLMRGDFVPGLSALRFARSNHRLGDLVRVCAAAPDAFRRRPSPGSAGRRRPGGSRSCWRRASPSPA